MAPLPKPGKYPALLCQKLRVKDRQCRLPDHRVGWPDPLFQVLMWIELSVPVVVGIVVCLPTRHQA
jgi:hypothetical protein